MTDLRSSGIAGRAMMVAAALALCACSGTPPPQAATTLAPTVPEALPHAPPPPPPASPAPPDKATAIRQQDFSEAIRAFYGCLGRAANELDTTGSDPREAGKTLIAACNEERAKSIAVWSKGLPAKAQAEYARQRDPDDLEVATNLILNRRAKNGI